MSHTNFSNRNPLPEVNELFHQRWSPRAFKKTTISSQTISTIFDAARWAPSCFNAQPWLFVTSSNEKDFDIFLSLLNESNQVWAKNAGLIGFIFAKKTFAHNGTDNNKAKFDCGAAWMSLTLQANLNGLHTHGIGGIDYANVYKTLNISADDHDIICGFALGEVDTVESLPSALQEKEKPSARKALDDIWQAGIQ
ncbi:MAG: nitroreductase family protein [Cycloclasticus sp.]